MKSIFTFIRNVCLAAVVAIGFAACQSDDTVLSPADTDLEPASLTFTLSLPKATVSTRGYADVDADWEDATNWSIDDKLIDGRTFYRVTVFLIDSEDRLVGFRDIYKGNAHLCEHNGFINSEGNVDTSLDDADEVRVSFLYDDPKHGEIERLHRGKYRLMAVANYSKYEDLTSNLAVGYQTNLTTFATLVQGIKTDFIDNKGDEGIANFNATNYAAFFNARLDAGDDRICPKQPQPLTLVTDVNLQPGDNQVEGELVRTYSRIRIEVENNASHQDEDLELTVKSLTFPNNNFAQRYAYLFSDPDNEDRNYNDMGRGAMTLKSTDAIVPFSAAVTIAELNTADDATVDNDKVIFDAYILESKDEAKDYTYTLGLEYAKCEEDVTTYTTNTTPITDYDDLTDGGYYLIKRNDKTQYLAAGTNSVTVATSDPVPTNPDETMVWQLERYSNYYTNRYYIKTVGTTSYYMLNPSTSSITLGATKGSYFTFSNSNSRIRMRSSGDGQRYITIDGDAKGSSWSNWADNNPRLFNFYSVTKGTATTAPSKTEKIVLKTIDPETAQVSKVTNIKRNDFVNVLVTVSYTPTSNNGYFTFEALPWVKKLDNYITYE